MTEDLFVRLAADMLVKGIKDGRQPCEPGIMHLAGILADFAATQPDVLLAEEAPLRQTRRKRWACGPGCGATGVDGEGCDHVPCGLTDR